MIVFIVFIYFLSLMICLFYGMTQRKGRYFMTVAPIVNTIAAMVIILMLLAVGMRELLDFIKGDEKDESTVQD